MRRAAAFACVGLGCAVPTAPQAISQVSVGGDSPLVAMFVRVGSELGVPPEELAAASWVRTRFRLATTSGSEAGESVGLVGIPAAFVPHAASLAGVTEAAIASDPEASLLAAAALIREGDLRALGGDGVATAVTAALARGVDGRDAGGRHIVIAAQPRSSRPGLGQISQSLDYAGATWAAASTSNYGTGARGIGAIDHIVIHDTEGSFASTVNWFQDPAAKVSAHYVVRSSDGHVDQMVAEKNIAWHDKCFNATTIGIEHEGYAAHPELWYTEPMYEASAKLTSFLADKYGIAKEHGPILGHGEAPDCSDHTDPGPGWNWDHYIELVQAGGAGSYLAGDITVDAPASLASGETGTVTVTVANHGTSAWDLDATRVATAEPADRDSALFVDGDWISPSRATSVDAQTPAGATGTFTFSIRGPDVTEPQAFDEAFQLVEEGSAAFGPAFHVALQVTPAGDNYGGPPLAQGGGCSTTNGSAGGLILVALAGLRRRRRRPR